MTKNNKNNIVDDTDCKYFLENSLDWEIWLDSENIIKWMSNACEKISGFSKEDLLTDKNIFMNIIVPDEKDKLIERNLSPFHSNPNIDNFTFSIKTKSGNIRLLEQYNKTIFDENNEIIGSKVTIRDITEWNQTKIEIIESKIKAEKAAKVAHTILDNLGHELRTPLNGIIGFSRILLNYTDDEDIKEMAQAIDISAERLRNTINSLLILNEVEQNKYVYVIDDCNLAEVVELYFRTTENLIKSNSLYLNVNIESKDINIKADEFLLVQILYQLLDNAIKFTRNGGISVAVKKENFKNKHYGLIELKDTGCGIPKEKFDIIFEPFRQANEGINRHYEGLGLGLTIVRKLITILKGQIAIESEVDSGTTFKLFFELEN